MLKVASMKAVPLQLGGMAALWLGGELLVRWLHMPVPGAVAGLAALLTLLWSGAIPVQAVSGGARWLHARMLVLFVPALLTVVQHREFFGLLGLKLLLVIGASTLAVMVVTSLVVEYGSRAAVLAHE